MLSFVVSVLTMEQERFEQLLGVPNEKRLSVCSGEAMMVPLVR